MSRNLDVEKVEKVVAAWIERRRPPVEIREKLDLGFRFDGRSIEIFEIRPAWKRPFERMEESVAKATYVKSWEEWRIYWQRADLRWHRYEPRPTVRSIEKFLAVVDEDEYCCFFG